VDFETAMPERIAEAVVQSVRRPPSEPVETSAAARVAEMIAELL
jgi:hypothetical protein